MTKRTKDWTRRCPWAIHFNNIATRCKKGPTGHGEWHEGRGLDQFPYQTIRWVKGHAHEYETERDDFYAWRILTEENLQSVRSETNSEEVERLRQIWNGPAA